MTETADVLKVRENAFLNLLNKQVDQNNVTLTGLPQSGKKSGKKIFFKITEKSGNFVTSQ